MADGLMLRLLRAPTRLSILASGPINAGNAHVLSNVVCGVLWRYAVPIIAVDLTHVPAVDRCAVSTILDCHRHAERRGVLLTVNGALPAVREVLVRHGASELMGDHPSALSRVRRGRPQTGTVCVEPSRRPR